MKNKMLAIEIQGTKKVINKINRIELLTKSDDLKVYLANKMISVINRFADERLSYDFKYVKSNKFIINEDNIVIYNDVVNANNEHYSLILEYGSGIYAEDEHIGTTQTFIASGFMYWFVPEEEAPDLFAYPYERIVTDSGVLYKVYGQTPKHIYEDSAKVIERNVARWVREYIKKELGVKI